MVAGAAGSGNNQPSVHQKCCNLDLSHSDAEEVVEQLGS